MAKVNVSIPDDLMREVDALAAELHRSRSGFVQEATASYVSRLREERAAQERWHSIDSAMTEAGALGAELAGEAGGFDATGAIRADRDRDDMPRAVKP